MFTFEWPSLILLLILPFISIYFFSKRINSNSELVEEIRFPHLHRIQNAFGVSGSQSKNKNVLFWTLLFSAWIAFTFAMMGPERVDQLSEVKNEGHDLMLAVDLSGSMQSLDFSDENVRVSRLDVAKSVVKDFVKKRGGDRIGLVLFGEHAYLQAPLTLDTQAVTQMLDNSLPGMAGDSTAIGDAIGLAVKNLKERPSKSRAIILLTDGDDNASTIPPLQAAELAKQYGVHIYTIVIGKEGLVPFPDGHGGIVTVESQVDTTLTQKIAKITGGEFFRSTDRESLQKIYEQIDALEKSESKAQTILIRKPLYPYPLALGLLFFGVLGIIAQLSRNEAYEFTSI